MECGQKFALFDENDEDDAAIIRRLIGFALYVSNPARMCFNSRWYSQVHKVLSAMICIFGMLANIVHILVLTRPVMKRSTVNRVVGQI